MSRRLAVSSALIFGMLMSGAARAADPPLKSGRDPSGTPIAILSGGLDYTRPEIARLLARDGEGEAIAWDTVDGDHRPFEKDSEGAETALAAAALGGVRIIPIRITEGDRTSLAQAIAFAAGTPARIVLAPLSEKARTEIEVLAAAAQKFQHVLFIASLPTLTDDEKKRSESVTNLVLLDARDRKLVAAESVARALGCGNADLTGESGAEKKRELLSRLEIGTRSKDAQPATCETNAGKKSGQP
jgi:hypothetical protein